MGLIYALILSVIGFYIGNSVHVVLAWVLAAAGLCLGFMFRAAGNRQRAVLVSEASATASKLPVYKAAYRDLEIVGESFRQRAIRKLWNPDTTYDAVMVPEDGNPHDKNAVRVEIAGIQVGYLSRETARDYRRHMGDGRCRVPVHLVMGGPQGTIGVFTGKCKQDKAKGDAE